ncbi:MAG TPA: DUF805 domain-containing protein [Solimonas sp.]
MNFAEVLTKSFLLSYDGRINRQRYWAFVLVYLAVVIVAAIIDGILGIQFVVLLVVLASIYPSICVTIKRWHDRDKSGWWILIGLVPVIGGIWSFVECGCLEGTQGPNRFGADPIARTAPVA